MITYDTLRKECSFFYKHGYQSSFKNTLLKIKNIDFINNTELNRLIDFLMDAYTKYPGGFMQNQNELDNWVKELTKVIQTQKEKESYSKMDEPHSEKENNRLFYRALHK